MGRLLCDRRACVCVCALRSLVLASSGGVGCVVRRRACLDAGGLEGRRACICARALAMLVRGGACCRRSSVVRVAARAIALACACASLASARVFGRRRSYRTERAPPRLLRGGGGLHMHARRCGPLVASRPPGDLKNTTNTHPVSLGHPPVSFGLLGPGFWLGYIFFAWDTVVVEMFGGFSPRFHELRSPNGIESVVLLF